LERTRRTARPRDRPAWQPFAGGMCLHTILLYRTDPHANLYRHLGAGAFAPPTAQYLEPINKGLYSVNTFPSLLPKSATVFHHVAMHPSRPTFLFMSEALD